MTFISEESGEPLTQHRDDGTGYLTDYQFFIAIFESAQKLAADLLLKHRNVEQPTAAQQLECMREAADFFQIEAGRYLESTRNLNP